MFKDHEIGELTKIIFKSLIIFITYKFLYCNTMEAISKIKMYSTKQANTQNKSDLQGRFSSYLQNGNKMFKTRDVCRPLLGIKITLMPKLCFRLMHLNIIDIIDVLTDIENKRV